MNFVISLRKNDIEVMLSFFYFQTTRVRFVFDDEALVFPLYCLTKQNKTKSLCKHIYVSQQVELIHMCS
jgi:hypothetical protein